MPRDGILNVLRIRKKPDPPISVTDAHRPRPDLGPEDLLFYLAAHRVLICKECRYAIQPKAVTRHLKEQHNIYKAGRRPFVQFVQTLDLAPLDHLPLPPPDAPPIPFVPVEHGLACGAPGCAHLCITVKRMKWHWAAEHRPSVAEAFWRPVYLQTFFRGNQLRYFVVNVEHAGPTEADLAKQWSESDGSVTQWSWAEDGLYVSRGSNESLKPSNHIESHDRVSHDIISHDIVTRDIINHDIVSHDTINDVDGRANDMVRDDDLQDENIEACCGTLRPPEDELWTQFTTSTYLTLIDLPNTEHIWRDAVPRFADQYPHLRHGLLACAALHLAALHPERRSYYVLGAAHHQNIALAGHRVILEHLTTENCSAVVIFSQLLVIHTFATQADNDNLLLIGGDPDYPLPDWLLMMRSGCTIMGTLWDLVRAGPLAAFLDFPSPCVMPGPDHDDECVGPLHVLRDLPFVEPCTEERDANQQAYLSALCSLHAAFGQARAIQERLSVRLAVYIWPTILPEAYFGLLRDRHPAALILLAHYCVMIRGLETEWYVIGFSHRMLVSIWQQLGEEWRPWIRWPMEVIDIDPREI